MRLIPAGLTARAAGGISLLVLLMVAGVLASLDHFVGSEVRALEAQRAQVEFQRVQDRLAMERHQMGVFAGLAGRDSDLHQSAQYHLQLEGEDRALKDDLDRLADAFQLGFIMVQPLGDRPPIIRTTTPDAEQYTRVKAGGRPRFIWSDGALMVFANYPLVVNGRVLGYVAGGRSANDAVGEDFELGPLANRPQPADRSSDPLPFDIVSPTGEPVQLALTSRNPLSPTVERMNIVVLVVLLAGGGLLLLLAWIYLRHILKPIRALSTASSSVPERIRQRDPEFNLKPGPGEIGNLQEAFRNMVGELIDKDIREQEAREHCRLSAIGQVAVRVAHDINNPISIIKSTAFLLKQETPASNQQAHEDLDRISYHCDRCTGIIDNLLRFGKPLKLRTQVLQIGGCMQSFLDDFAVRAPQARVEFVCAEPDTHFLGDWHQFCQMMDNLLENATHWSPTNSVFIGAGRTGNGYVWIKVSDDGPGFDDVIAQQAFEPFVTGKTDGTGFGLANAKAIAKNHGGDMRVTSPGCGEITIWLPELSPDGAASASYSGSARCEALTDTQGS